MRIESDFNVVLRRNRQERPENGNYVAVAMCMSTSWNNANVHLQTNWLLANARSKGYDTDMTKKESFSEQLRRAIRESELTRYQIWQRTGILQSVLSRFVNGGSVSLDTADKLVELLGLELAAKDKSAKKRKTRGS